MKLKSNEMPEPQVINYMKYYKITPLFINDLKKVLCELAFVDAKKYIDRAIENDSIMSIAILNEYIRDLANLPYKIVSTLMTIINDSEKFVKYFQPIEIQDIMKINSNALGVSVDESQNKQ